MAKYEHLLIFKETYSLLIEFHKLVPTFPKKYKFILGSQIIEDLTNLLLKIIEINSSFDKRGKFDELILGFEKIQIQIRILNTLLVLSKNSYFLYSQKVLSILKQCEGWKKKC